MSVILDALHKARGDNRKNKVEQHPNSVARVLEPGVVGHSVSDTASRTRRGWGLPVMIILGGMCFLTLLGGAFFLLYDQIRQLNVPSAATVATQPAPVVQPAATSNPVAVLPPPLPVSELPVQPPVANPVVPTVVAEPVAATNNNASQSAFKLGSIVCEGNDCIAHLNGRTIRPGDQVKQYRVSKITPTDVTLQGRSPADTIVLSLYD